MFTLFLFLNYEIYAYISNNTGINNPVIFIIFQDFKKPTWTKVEVTDVLMSVS